MIWIRLLASVFWLQTFALFWMIVLGVLPTKDIYLIILMFGFSILTTAAGTDTVKKGEKNES